MRDAIAKLFIPLSWLIIMMTRQFRLFFLSSVLDFSLPLHICGTNIGHCF